MLTDQEAEATFYELNEILRIEGLEHIAEEVASEIRLGKIEAKKVDVAEAEQAEDYLLTVRSNARKRTVTFTGSVEFTPHEKLRLLVDSVRRATIDLAEMHEESARIFLDVMRQRVELSVSHPENASTFRFVDEGRERDLVSDKAKRENFTTVCQSLAPLLNEIEQQLYAPTS